MLSINESQQANKKMKCMQMHEYTLMCGGGSVGGTMNPKKLSVCGSVNVI